MHASLAQVLSSFPVSLLFYNKKNNLHSKVLLNVFFTKRKSYHGLAAVQKINIEMYFGGIDLDVNAQHIKFRIRSIKSTDKQVSVKNKRKER